MRFQTSLGDSLHILVGSAIGGAGCAFFLIPGQIAAGGVNGLGTISYHLFGFDPGIVMLALNVPLILAGMRIFGWRYGLRSVIGSLLFSFSTTLFGQITGYRTVLSCGEPMSTLLSAIFGGVLVGGGIGLVMRTGANTGGTDIIAQILHKYTPLSMGFCAFLPDAIVLLLGFGVFGLEKGLFAIIDVYVASVALDFVVMGIGKRHAKSVFIFSGKHEQIADFIILSLVRGGTLFSGTGIYTRKDREMLYTVIPNQQIYPLMRLIHVTDPEAFVIVTEAYQVMGDGFVPMERVVNAHPLESGKGQPERLA